MFGHLKINRAVTTCYDQLASSFLGMAYLATAGYWLRFFTPLSHHHHPA